MVRRPLLALALLLAAPAAGQTLPPPAPTPLPEWMAGTWSMIDGSAWADEIWSDERGGAMIGVGRIGFGPQLDSWEVMRIVRKADGRLVFLAQPGGKSPAVEFPLATMSEQAIEFANPAQDYPQRIRYWRQGQLLMAEIARIDGSRAVRWNFRPVAPPPPDGAPPAP
jgi:Domain of unknown function (DUF6265)